MKATSLLLVTAVSASVLRPGMCQTQEELAREVRSTEVAFAQTMADRDMEAFVSFVDDEAVFFGKDQVLRGIEAIKAGWSPFFEDTVSPFSWRPEVVEVLDSGKLALSSGPVHDPEGRSIGTFNSVWRLGTDGRWRVVFDKGCPPCDCAEAP